MHSLHTHCFGKEGGGHLADEVGRPAGLTCRASKCGCHDGMDGMDGLGPLTPPHSILYVGDRCSRPSTCNLRVGLGGR